MWLSIRLYTRTQHYIMQLMEVQWKQSSTLLGSKTAAHHAEEGTVEHHFIQHVVLASGISYQD